MKPYACVHCGSRVHLSRDCPRVVRASPADLDEAARAALDLTDRVRDEMLKARRKDGRR